MGFIISAILKKAVALIFIMALALNAYAPDRKSLVIVKAQPAEPFRKLIKAIGKVETKEDTLAFNPLEGAVGYFKIREIRLKDYNQRTQSNFTSEDLYNYHISEKIFLYYASKIGPYNFEKIARNWNGSGRMTYAYWQSVKEHL